MTVPADITNGEWILFGVVIGYLLGLALGSGFHPFARVGWAVHRKVHPHLPKRKPTHGSLAPPPEEYTLILLDDRGLVCHEIHTSSFLEVPTYYEYGGRCFEYQPGTVNNPGKGRHTYKMVSESRAKELRRV